MARSPLEILKSEAPGRGLESATTSLPIEERRPFKLETEARVQLGSFGALRGEAFTGPCQEPPLFSPKGKFPKGNSFSSTALFLSVLFTVRRVF